MSNAILEIFKYYFYCMYKCINYRKPTVRTEKKIKKIKKVACFQ